MFTVESHPFCSRPITTASPLECEQPVRLAPQSVLTVWLLSACCVLCSADKTLLIAIIQSSLLILGEEWGVHVLRICFCKYCFDIDSPQNLFHG